MHEDKADNKLPNMEAFLDLCHASSVRECIFYTEHSREALTFSQKVFKEPSGVVLWILQMDIGSPPGSWSVVQSLFHAHTHTHTQTYATML